MKAFAKQFGGIWLGISVVLLVGTVIAVLCQISFRYFLGLPLSWTEEAARLMLVTGVYAALPAAYIRGEHIVVDLWINILPERIRRIYIGAMKVIVLFVCLYLTAGAVLQVEASHAMTFISMPWLSVAVLYVVQAAAMLSMGILVLLTWRDPEVYAPSSPHLELDA